MTITPLPLTPAAPAPGGAAAPTGQPGSAAAALFGLLVGQHLESATVAVPVVATVPTPVQPDAPTAGAPTAALSLVVPASVVVTDSDTDEQPDVTAEGASVTADQVPTLPGGLAGLTLVVLPVPATAVPQAAPTRDAAGETQTAAESGAAPVTAMPTPVRPDVTSQQPTQQAAADGSVTGLAAGLGAVVAAGAATATATPTTPANASAVLDQVLPAVPRIVVRGDGTTRLTLKLHPADLGEVHLTVSVRGKEVDVTLAAGAQARAALSEGSSRLRSLLEGIGHTTGQVVVRDLPSATPPGSAIQPSGSPLGSQAFGQSNGQTDGRTDGWADGWTGGQGHHRPDGSQHDGSRRDDPSSLLRPTGTVRQQPSAAAGLDVTI